MNKFYKGISILVINSMLLVPTNTFAFTKTETIYSNLNSSGEVKKTNYSVGLTNLDKGDIIDYTKLDEIKNVNGEEKFSRESEKITWKSTGKDIYYKGLLNDNLPITVNAKYYLNGEEKNIKDMIGKSGSIKMVFNFKNNSYDYNSGMYTPFVVSTVSIINGKDNSNVNVSSGKVITTGNKNIVTGISAPGLYESTNIYELRNMDKITITYDTNKFSMNDIYFVITPKLLEEVDLDLSKVNNITSSLNTLQEGVNKLENGSNTIVEGQNNFNNGLIELNKGLEEATKGSEQLYNGLLQINENTNQISSLNTLVDTLYNTYKSNNELLNNINNGTTSEQLQEGIKNATIEKTNLENKLNEVNTGIAMLEQASTMGVITEEQQLQLETLKSQKTQIEVGITKYSEGIAEAENNLKSLPLAVAKINGANEVIIKVLCGLLGANDPSMISDETINIFKTKINTLVGGIDTLTNGSKELNIGMNKLSEGSNKLVEGSIKLSEGNNELKEGISKLNNEGIHKLTNYSNKINNYSYKVETLINLSKNYKGFTSNNANKTIFIYKLSK